MIAIIGAGPSGLCLASILNRNGYSVTVYERDASSSARTQGGSLDIHESGQIALAEAGCIEGFKALARYDDQVYTIMDRHGNVHHHGLEENRPEIDRSQLRNILLNAFPYVKWNSKVTKVEPGKVFLQSGPNQECHTYDLIIGADGAWSRVRPLITPIIPNYSGTCYFEGNISVDDLPSHLFNYASKGTVFAFGNGDGKFLATQRQSNGNLKVYLMTNKPEDWSKGLKNSDSKTLRQLALNEVKEWSSHYHDIINSFEEGTIVVRNLYTLPSGITWESKGNDGICLIGDAAHLMFPSGDGVNVGLSDASYLAEKIMTCNNLTQAIKEYEEWMFKNAYFTMVKSEKIMEMTKSDHGIETFKKITSIGQ